MTWTVALMASRLLGAAAAAWRQLHRFRTPARPEAPAIWTPPRWATTHAVRHDAMPAAEGAVAPRQGKRGKKAAPPPSVSTSAPWVTALPLGPGAETAQPSLPRIRRPSLASRIKKLLDLTPQDIDARLLAAGYQGQPEARRVASVIAYRHVRRLRRMWIDGVPASELPPRDNLLLVGPTGSGKTHLVELVFREVLHVPTIVVDITQFSETGYSGSDLTEIPGRLFEAAGGDPFWCRCGAICLDEFDKLRGDNSSGKDVSGYGVQRSLLTLLTANSAQASGHGPSGRYMRTVSLESVTFFACGAFSGLEQAHAARRGVGFGAGHGAPTNEPLDLGQQTAVLERYGFLPELIGRFTRTVTLSPLGTAELRGIAERLRDAYARDLAADGLGLAFGPTELDAVVQRALQRGTGARGLRAEMQKRIEELQFGLINAKGGKAA